MSDRTTINDVGLSCSTCFYWQSVRQGVGICQRFPPRIVDEDGYGSSFIRTDSDAVCGEWRTDQEPPAGLDLAETPDHVCELCEGTGARDGKTCDGCAGVGAV